MRRIIRFSAVRIFVLMFLLQLNWGTTEAKDSVPITYDKYYDYEEVTSLLKQFEKAYPKFLTLESIGKSYQNREMWVMTINNPDTGEESDKAAMYIDANIHGNEVQGTETILYTIDYLMKNYGKIEKATKLVDKRVFYLIPMVNPDGRAHWFDTEDFGSGARSGMRPIDNDNDGLFDEDGYDDIDGDGQILQMRKKVTHGNYKLNPKDPRVLERAETGEFGNYERLGSEGIDNDGDGRVNEDGPGGYDMNRNWPSDWQPRYVQYGAGNYPLSHPETRSIALFILDHPNIAAVQSYHNSGGMILRGPGAKSEGRYPVQDRRVYDYLGNLGEEILPFYDYYVIWKDLYTVHGGFVNWTAEGLGIFSFSNELWTSDKYFFKEDKRREGESRYEQYYRRQFDRLKFDDYVELGEKFVEWKPFDHPTYGKIELGGWVRQTNRVPPTFLLSDLCHRNTAFTLFHADQMPLVGIDTIEVEKLGDDSYKFWVTVINKKAIPTISQQAAQNHLVRPDILRLDGNNIEVVSSGLVYDRYFNRVSLIKDRPERVLLEDGIGGNSTLTVQFLVSGRGKATVQLDCVKGGTVQRIVNLR